MGRAAPMRIGKMQCPECLGMVNSQASACRHCGYRFSPEEIERQEEFEAKQRKLAGKLAVFVVPFMIAMGALFYHEATRPLTPQEQADQSERERDTAQASARFMARGTAGAAVKERMKNPGSFDLVEADANPARTDDGQPCWLVAVTYRGTNSFGGVVTERAFVWVDQTGMKPLKVRDVR